MSPATTLSNDASLASDYWELREAKGELTRTTRARYQRVFASFVRFVAAHHHTRLIDVNTDMCRRFVFAPRRGGAAPAASTSRFRLTVVRDAYIALSSTHGISVDPTAPLRVPQPAQARALLPLTPSELARLRAAGRLAPRDHLRPAAVELALAGGSHAEIAAAVVRDVDVVDGTCRLAERTVAIDAFALATLRGRIAACRANACRSSQPWNPDTVALALRRPLNTYPPTSIAPGISSALARAMNAAGLTREGLASASIRQFGANRAFARQGRAEDVARFLGMSSLDAAMGFVAPQWQELYAEEFRQ